MQRDPIGFAAGDLNLYAYTWNNPTRWTDPSGLAVTAYWASLNARAGTGAGFGGLMAGFQRLMMRIARELAISAMTGATEDDRDGAGAGAGAGAGGGGGDEECKPEDPECDQCVPDSTRNNKLAGQKHPVTGVSFDSQGYPIFEYVVQVTVNMQGNYKSDIDLANLAAGYETTPDGYTWHHHQDGKTMQLVDKKIHQKTGHDGGVKTCKGRNNE